MPAESTLVYDNIHWHFIAATTYSSGQILQHPDGRAAIVMGLKSIASGDMVCAALEGQFEIASASATLFAIGEEVWWNDAGGAAIRRESATSTSFRLGVARKAKVNGDTVVLVDLNSTGNTEKVIAAPVAASAALTASSTETVIATAHVPANTLKPGSILEVFAQIIATATNSTDTFRFRVRVGGLTGSVIADTGAIDLADNDVGTILARLQIRTDGATGTMVGAGHGVLKTTAFNTALGSTAIDTTAALTVVLTGTISTTSASNSCRCDIFQATHRVA